VDFDFNPYETDEERAARKRAEVARALELASGAGQPPEAVVQDRVGMLNDALARTGAEYRVPVHAQEAQERFEARGGTKQPIAQLNAEQEAALAAALPRAPASGPVSAPEPEPVSRTEFNPRVSTRQLQEEFTGAQNESLGNYAARSDVIAASGERREALYDEAEQLNRAGTDEARAHTEAARAEREQFERLADERLNRLAALVDNPPEEAFNAGRAIMGAILSHGSNGRVSDGREAMARETAMMMARWKAEIEGNKELAEAYLGRSKHATGKAFDDQKLDAALLDMAMGSMKVALEREKAAADTEEKVIAADEALNTLRQGMVNSELMKRQQQAATQAGGQRSKQDDEILRYLAGLPEEQRSEAAMQLGGRAVELWKKAQANFAGDAALTEKRTQAVKNLADGSPASKAEQIEVPGLKPLAGATDKDKTEAQKIMDAHATLDASLVAMKSLQGKVDSNSMKEYELQHALAVGALNGLANAGVLNPGELQAWNKRLPKHAIRNATDIATGGETGGISGRLGALVNVAGVDEEEFFDSTRSHFKAITDTKLRTHKYERAPLDAQSEQPTAPARAPAGTGGGTVQMLSPSGRPFAIPADRVKDAEAKGFKLQRLAGTSGGW